MVNGLKDVNAPQVILALCTLACDRSNCTSTAAHAYPTFSIFRFHSLLLPLQGIGQPGIMLGHIDMNISIIKIFLHDW